MNMSIDTVLPIVIEGHTFTANQDRMWNLNEIQKGLGLPDSKSPSKWDNEISRTLEASRNFVKVDKVGSFADELGTIAYAMWVSPEFYLMVAGAFLSMRNDAVLSARMAGIALVEKDALLADNMPKASALMLKADGLGLSWTDACRAAGVLQSRLAKDVLVSAKVFRTVWDHDRGNDVIEPSPQQFKSGLFKRAKGLHGNLEGWRVSAKGLNWLTEKSSKINDGVRDLNTNKRLSKRTPAQVSHDFVSQVQRGVYSRNNNKAGGQ